MAQPEKRWLRKSKQVIIPAITRQLGPGAVKAERIFGCVYQTTFMVLEQELPGESSSAQVQGVKLGQHLLKGCVLNRFSQMLVKTGIL